MGLKLLSFQQIWDTRRSKYKKQLIYEIHQSPITSKDQKTVFIIPSVCIFVNLSHLLEQFRTNSQRHLNANIYTFTTYKQQQLHGLSPRANYTYILIIIIEYVRTSLF
jgi:hypothetical protein